MIKGLFVFVMLSTASLAFAMNDARKIDSNNNNNNTPANQKELMPSECIQEQLDLLKKDPKNNIPGMLTLEGMLFLMKELPLDLQKEIARKVFKSLPIYTKILQKIEMGCKNFIGHTNTSVVPSPDSKYVITGSRDKTARLWDISEFKIDDLLNKITISQLYLLMLIDDALKNGTECEITPSMKPVFDSFGPKIKKILDELIKESELEEENGLAMAFLFSLLLYLKN